MDVAALDPNNLLFWFCPGCQVRHAVPVKQGAQGQHDWKWNSSLTTPTLEPSILVFRMLSSSTGVAPDRRPDSCTGSSCSTRACSSCPRNPAPAATSTTTTAQGSSERMTTTKRLLLNAAGYLIGAAALGGLVCAIIWAGMAAR